MFNPNAILKTTYRNAIRAVLPTTPVHKNYVPNDLKTDAYVLISNVQNVDYSNINKHSVKAFVTIGIYTRTVTENDGLTCDDIATAILGLYPTPQSYPTITGYQVASVILESDNELTVPLDSGNIYINRTITFSHILNKLN